MTFKNLLLRSLLFHWRHNLAVLLGVFVGTAVLTGALLVGDSLQGSLRARALDQLGWVDEAMVTSRFFQESLANKLPATKVSPAILLQCSASFASSGGVAQANKVTLLAVDDRFWPDGAMPLNQAFWRQADSGVALNKALADRLGVKVGDQVALSLQSTDNVPRETLLGKRKSDDVLSKLTVTVKAIVPDEGMGRFTVRPGPEAALNAFVPLRLIQDRFDPDTKKALLKGRANALFVAGATAPLDDALKGQLTLDDWGLTLRSPVDRAKDLFKLLAAGEDQRPNWDGMLRKYRWNGRISEELARLASTGGELTESQFIDFFIKHHNYLSLESSRVFLEPAIVQASRKACTAANTAAENAFQGGQETWFGPYPNWQTCPTFAYMVDTLSDGKNEAPYVIVAALDPQLSSPVGPIQPQDQPPLQDNLILLAKWSGCPLQFADGLEVTLDYDVPDASGKLERREAKLKFAGWVPLHGAADDADLTPRFEGITDRLSTREWADNLPFPVTKRRLKRADNEYWDRYRATPKAYVTLATGQRLWGNRFGNVTGVRIAVGNLLELPPFKVENENNPESVGQQIAQHSANYFRELLVAQLDPTAAGFTFNNVKQQAFTAGQGSSDFGMLFLGFSFFLIVAALLLVGLMFRLSLDQRAREMGLLLAVGWRRSSVRWLALAEGVILAVVGGLLGVGGAVLYAGLLLDFLAEWWPGGLDRSFLRLHVDWQSCLIGYLAALLISVMTIWWSTRVLGKVPPRALLAGETIVPALRQTGGFPISDVVTLLAIICTLGCAIAGFLATDHEAQAGSFFGSGIFALTALLAGLWRWMHRNRLEHGPTMPSVARLGLRNATRHPLRSTLTVGLLAAASFMVMAVQAFHRDPGHDFLQKTGGSGGFAWVGESTVPIFQDLDTPTGRAELQLPRDLAARIISFRVQPGDDVSCLNLYRPRQPRILGVPQALVERGGFQFADFEREKINGSPANPWRLLLPSANNDAISAIGEANTVKWILKSGLGQEISIQDGQGKPATLKIVALLQDCVFQSELLISQDDFLRLFPRQEGFQFFLIEAPVGDEGVKVKKLLETGLADYGFSMTPASQRLQSYLDVENTYLATFQALGGLGLLLGTLGLAVVLVRGVWERRGELALLRALGFRQSTLAWLVLAENFWLLGLGLAFGCVAALIAVAPVVASQAGEVLQFRVLALLASAVVVGLAAGYAAMRTTLRTPLLPALRRE